MTVSIRCFRRKAHLKLDLQALAALHKEKFPVVPA
jgi:hypothetical protein